LPQVTFSSTIALLLTKSANQHFDTVSIYLQIDFNLCLYLILRLTSVLLNPKTFPLSE